MVPLANSSVPSLSTIGQSRGVPTGTVSGLSAGDRAAGEVSSTGSSTGLSMVGGYLSGGISWLTAARGKL